MNDPMVAPNALPVDGDGEGLFPRHWIPLACAFAAIAAVGFRFVLPALADAERLDAERVAFDNTARSLRGASHAAERLMTERDRLRSEIDAATPAISAGILRQAVRGDDGLLHLDVLGTFAEVSELLHAVDHAAGITVREFTLERQASPDQLRLQLTLDPVAPPRPVEGGVAGVAEEIR